MSRKESDIYGWIKLQQIGEQFYGILLSAHVWKKSSYFVRKIY